MQEVANNHKTEIIALLRQIGYKLTQFSSLPHQINKYIEASKLFSSRPIQESDAIIVRNDKANNGYLSNPLYPVIRGELIDEDNNLILPVGYSLKETTDDLINCLSSCVTLFNIYTDHDNDEAEHFEYVLTFSVIYQLIHLSNYLGHGNYNSAEYLYSVRLAMDYIVKEAFCKSKKFEIFNSYIDIIILELEGDIEVYRECVRYLDTQS